jgi:hypothetical protein
MIVKTKSVAELQTKRAANIYSNQKSDQAYKTVSIQYTKGNQDPNHYRKSL